MDIRICLLLLGLSVSTSLVAQTKTYRPVTTALPSLQIAPDARGAGHGDQGVGTSADIYAQYWNPAKYTFLPNRTGVALAYTPWLRQLVNDVSLTQLVGYAHLDRSGRHALAASLRYFSIGKVTLWDALGNTLGVARPNEMAVDFSYSYKLSPYFSTAVALRWANAGRGGVLGQSSQSVIVFDLAGYMQYPIRILEHRFVWRAGVNIKNVGTKISFDKGKTNAFLPQSLNIGTGLEYSLLYNSSLSLSIEATKLLVPVYPVRSAYPSSDPYEEALRSYKRMSSLSAIWESFSDAPGGLREELKEVRWGIGMEYSYRDFLRLRVGYSYLSPEKGNLQALSLGGGIHWKAFTLDVAYLISTIPNNPLDQTLRLSLSIGFDSFSSIFKE